MGGCLGKVTIVAAQFFDTSSDILSDRFASRFIYGCLGQVFFLPAQHVGSLSKFQVLGPEAGQSAGQSVGHLWNGSHDSPKRLGAGLEPLGGMHFSK